MLLWAASIGFVWWYAVLMGLWAGRHRSVRQAEATCLASESTLSLRCEALPLEPVFFHWTAEVEAQHGPTRRFSETHSLQSVVVLHPRWPRGDYSVDVTWRLQDNFGFFRLVPRQCWKTRLVVPPVAREFHPPRVPARFSGSQPVRRPSQRRGDPFDVRRYTPGDDLRRFHWALFAHSGVPYVRTPDPSPPPSGLHCFVLDIEAHDEAELDHRIGCLLSWIEKLDDAHSPWTLTVPAVRLADVGAESLTTSLAGLSPTPWPLNEPSLDSLTSPILLTGPDSGAAQALQHRGRGGRWQTVVIGAPPATLAARRPWWSRA